MSYPDTPAIGSHVNLICTLSAVSVARKFGTAEGDTIIVNVNMAIPIPGAKSVAVYVIEYSPTKLGVPESCRVDVSKSSPGTSGVREYVNSPLPPVASGRVTDSIDFPSVYTASYLPGGITGKLGMGVAVGVGVGVGVGGIGVGVAVGVFVGVSVGGTGVGVGVRVGIGVTVGVAVGVGDTVGVGVGVGIGSATVTVKSVRLWFGESNELSPTDADAWNK